MLHYTIIIIAVIAIIYFQFVFFRKNYRKQKELANIFPNDISSKIDRTEIDGIIVIDSTYTSPIFLDITTTINDYLSENKGAASDFHLIKDVVDRNCDSVEEEISTLTPIPLYFGLIGTMIGILIGVGFLVFMGGIDALLSTQKTNASSGIVELLGGVALAMISSISGIFLTTIGSYLNKGAKTTLDRNKNAFLSWIQIKLLPTLSGNATSAIYTLQQNLSTFNQTFAANIKGLGEAFFSINQSHKDQLKLMQLIEKMDVSQMAKANVQVLRELQKSTTEFDRFNQYIYSVNDYLDNVQLLNKGLNEHLNRTKVIEDMGVFFKEEIQQIESRKGTISRIVGDIDNTLFETLSKLNENAEQQLNEFIKHSVAQQEKFSKVTEEQQERTSKSIIDQQQKFNQAIETQSIALKERLQETSKLIEELNNLSSIKSSMKNIEVFTSEQNNRISELTSTIQQLVGSKSHTDTLQSNESNSPFVFPRWLKFTIISACGIAGVAGSLYIIIQLSEVIKGFIR